MRCPYCKTPVARENVHECPRCGLSHAKVARMFGAPPQTLPGITDATGELGFFQRRAIRRDLSRIELRFPQVRIAVFVTGGLDQRTPLNTYTFWLFNNGNVCPRLEKGALNHTILLVIDTTNARASLTVGYGLESYIDESHLGAILESSRAAFAHRAAGGAVRAILRALADVLGAVHRSGGMPQSHAGALPAETRPKKPSAVMADY